MAQNLEHEGCEDDSVEDIQTPLGDVPGQVQQHIFTPFEEVSTPLREVMHHWMDMSPRHWTTY